MTGGLIALRIRPERPLFVGVVAITILIFPPLVLLAIEAAVAGDRRRRRCSTGIGIELFSVFWDTSLQAHVPNEVLSRVSAWDAIGSLVLIPAAYAIVGPLADAIGIDETLWICAGIVFVAITAQLLSRQVRELPRLPPEPVAAYRVRGYANPVTSQRRRRKRAPISARRVTMSRTSAAQTPRTPQPAQATTASVAAHTEERGRHRQRQVAPVARADQDPVDREDDPVERLHQREERPQQRALGEHGGVGGEGLRDHAGEDQQDDARTPRRPRSRARSSARSPRRPRPGATRRAPARR